MMAVSAFSDWNPSHFLDVGEMTMAVAIGYDWLYDEMTADERATVVRAIIDKGLKPAQNEADAWFYRSEINWNSVCNAGMVYGALAVWEEDPDFCRSMLEKSIDSNQLAYKAYAGGGYPEGYNYWGYGTSFQIMLEAALESALRWPVAAGHDENHGATGHDDPLSVMPGLTGHLSDVIKNFGGSPANFLDVGGSATTERVKAAFEILLSDGNVKAIFVNIFGGIMKCDIIADGLVQATREMGISIPIVVRLEGTNVELGQKIIEESGLSIIAASDMADGARKAIAAAKGERV